MDSRCAKEICYLKVCGKKRRVGLTEIHVPLGTSKEWILSPFEGDVQLHGLALILSSERG